jgi:hypothetical protein
LKKPPASEYTDEKKKSVAKSHTTTKKEMNEEGEGKEKVQETLRCAERKGKRDSDPRLG